MHQPRDSCAYRFILAALLISENAVLKLYDDLHMEPERICRRRRMKTLRRRGKCTGEIQGAIE